MTIKNINVFKSSPIVIKINDSEQIKIDKVPALVTLTLYENEDFIGDLLEVEKSMTSLADVKTLEGDDSDIVEKIVREKQSKVMSISSQIAKYCKKYYKIIIDVMTMLFDKDERWVTENLGYMDMWNILLAVFYKNSEESAELLKKNNQA